MFITSIPMFIFMNQLINDDEISINISGIVEIFKRRLKIFLVLFCGDNNLELRPSQLIPHRIRRWLIGNTIILVLLHPFFRRNPFRIMKMFLWSGRFPLSPFFQSKTPTKATFGAFLSITSGFALFV